MSLAEQILYEDNHLIILNKRNGQIVQGDKTGDSCLVDEIKAFLKVRDHKSGNVFCGTVHRLDRPVSGVVVFAKTSKALSRMNAIVKGREIQKHYWAITKDEPQPPQGHLEDYLWRDQERNRSFIVKANHPDAKHAVLDYRLLARSKGGYYLIEVDLRTGRHHQIRAQLAHLGCPIKGDLKYGAPRSNPDGGISLHARFISFEHPVKHVTIAVTAPLPPDPLWQAFAQDDVTTLQSVRIETPNHDITTPEP